MSQNEIIYQLKRRRGLRGLRIHVLPPGRVVVSVGLSVSTTQIDQFVAQETQWINRQLSKLGACDASYRPKQFVENENFLVFGINYPLNISEHVGRRIHFDFAADHKSLLLSRPQAVVAESYHVQCAKSMREFYQREARTLLPRRLAHWSKIMNLTPVELKLRGQKSRWGSCSSQGVITLNWKLVVAPFTVIDYVIIHELAHLRHLNHSQDFWALVAHHMPFYREPRLWLKKNTALFYFLDAIKV